MKLDHSPCPLTSPPRSIRKEEPYSEQDSWGIPLTISVKSVVFTELNPKLTYIVYLLVRDSAWNSISDFLEHVPNIAGIVIIPP